MWLFPQHSCDINQFFGTLKIFEDMNGKIKDFSLQQNLLKLLKNKNLYNPQVIINDSIYDQSTANHKIDEVRFYGGIYETTNHKLHLSTYGELLLKYQDDLVKRKLRGKGACALVHAPCFVLYDYRMCFWGKMKEVGYLFQAEYVLI